MIETDITHATERGLAEMRRQVEAALPEMDEFMKRKALLALELQEVLHRFRARESEMGAEPVKLLQITASALGDCAAAMLGSTTRDMEMRRALLEPVISSICGSLLEICGIIERHGETMCVQETASVHHA